jgi:hypothetical protein
MKVNPNNDFVRNAYKSFTFTGAAGFGAIGNCTVFTVTGGIHIVSVDVVVDTTVTVDGGTGAASLSYGVTNSTTLLGGTAIAATGLTSTNKHWQTTTPTANGIAQNALQKDIDISQNIVYAVTSTGTQLVNGGVLEMRVIWYPITAGATLV